MKRSGVFLALLLLASTNAAAQVTKQGNGYLLRYRFVKGQTWKYNIETVTRASAVGTQPANVKFPLQITVLDVMGNTAKLRVRGQSQTGQPLDQQITVDRRGRMVGTAAQGIGNVVVAELPEKPIPLNGTWTAGSAADTGMGAISGRSTFRLVRIGMVAGQQVAQINLTSELKGLLQGKLNGSIHLRVADGSVARLQNSISGRMSNPASTDGKPIPFNVTIRATRI